MVKSFITQTPEETVSLGVRLGSLLTGGVVLAMVGELAAGKTTMTRGIAEGLGCDDDIHSPTFTLIHEHPGRHCLNHIDLYRLETQADIDSLGLEDYIYGDGVVVIEWADRMFDELPPESIIIEFALSESDQRTITMRTDSAGLQEVLEEL